MDRGREKVFIFAVMPIVCLGIDTRLLSSLKSRFRTENNSHNILGNHDEFDLKEKYFDVVYKFVQSNRNSYMPGGGMQRTLRSFKTNNNIRTSIKREKEVYENLNDLQYYGSESPKKFTEKRRQIVPDNTWHNGVNGLHKPGRSDPNTDENAIKSADKRIKFSDPAEDVYSPVSNSPQLSNIPAVPEHIHISEINSTASNSQKLNFTTHSLDGNDVVISKRRFPPSRGVPLEEDVCNMDDLEIDIRFREMMETEAGSLLLTCTGSVVVRKCEGACNSQVKPSVNNYDGFERQCSCCKDSAVTTRSVRLSVCTLGPEEVHGYSISRTIVEPTACSCQECRN